MEKSQIGLRIKAAREASKMSQAQVAEFLGIDRSALSRIESGERRISALELDRLARHLDRPLSYFLADDRQKEQVLRADRIFVMEEPHEMLRADNVLPEDRLALQRFLDYCHTYAAVEEILYGALRYDVPVYPEPWQKQGREQGDFLAKQERNRLGLADSPVLDMFSLVESQGIKLYTEFIEGSELLGAFHFSEGLGPCIFVNEAQARAGKNFTVAHEYCHLLVDRETLGSYACPHPFGEHRQIPAGIRANAFAASFLMPEGVVRQILGTGPRTVEDILFTQHYFGVSFEAVLMRLEMLEMISSSQRSALTGFDHTSISRRVGYANHAAFDEAPDLKGRRFTRIVLEAYSRRRLTDARVAEILGMEQGEAAGLLQELTQLSAAAALPGANEELVTRVEPNLSQDQFGMQLTIDAVEFTPEETRVFVTAKNSMKSVGDFSAVGAALVQDREAYEVLFSDFIEQTSRLFPGDERSGIIVYPPLDPRKELRLVLHASSADLRLRFEPYFFTIPAKG